MGCEIIYNRDQELEHEDEIVAGICAMQLTEEELEGYMEDEYIFRDSDQKLSSMILSFRKNLLMLIMHWIRNFSFLCRKLQKSPINRDTPQNMPV